MLQQKRGKKDRGEQRDGKKDEKTKGQIKNKTLRDKKEEIQNESKKKKFSLVMMCLRITGQVALECQKDDWIEMSFLQNTSE